MADRIGVINRGEIILVEEKHALMRRLGQTRICVTLTEKMDHIPEGLFDRPLSLSPDGASLTFIRMGENDGKDDSLARLLKNLVARGIDFASVTSSQSSLEDIFIDLVGKSR